MLKDEYAECRYELIGTLNYITSVLEPPEIATLLIPTIVLGVFPNVILDTLHASITTLLYTVPLNPFF